MMRAVSRGSGRFGCPRTTVVIESKCSMQSSTSKAHTSNSRTQKGLELPVEKNPPPVAAGRLRACTTRTIRVPTPPYIISPPPFFFTSAPPLLPPQQVVSSSSSLANPLCFLNTPWLVLVMGRTLQ